jgi:hypothetical protein
MNAEGELTNEQLDAVSGGLSELSIAKHLDTASSGGGYVGGTGPTPSSAWNACLGVFGYPPQA